MDATAPTRPTCRSSPLLLKKAEIAAHQINHAMRFTIGNSKIDNTYYVHPDDAPRRLRAPNKLPYGARLRLKSSFDVSSLPNAEAQAVGTALQKYGMFLDDGGENFLRLRGDGHHRRHRHARTRARSAGADFEMVDGGTRYNFHQQNCTRTPITN